ncbi:hypothetical protein SANTM175S_00149 [Streptomyces antimycoticus]
MAGPVVGDIGQGPVVEAVPLAPASAESFCRARLGGSLTSASARNLPARAVVIWWSQAKAST